MLVIYTSDREHNPGAPADHVGEIPNLRWQTKKYNKPHSKEWGLLCLSGATEHKCMLYTLIVLKKVLIIVVLLLMLFIGCGLYVNNFQTIPNDGLCSDIETGEYISC